MIRRPSLHPPYLMSVSRLLHELLYGFVHVAPYDEASVCTPIYFTALGAVVLHLDHMRMEIEYRIHETPLDDFHDIRMFVCTIQEPQYFILDMFALGYHFTFM